MTGLAIFTVFTVIVIAALLFIVFSNDKKIDRLECEKALYKSRYMEAARDRDTAKTMLLNMSQSKDAIIRGMENNMADMKKKLHEQEVALNQKWNTATWTQSDSEGVGYV